MLTEIETQLRRSPQMAALKARVVDATRAVEDAARMDDGRPTQALLRAQRRLAEERCALAAAETAARGFDAAVEAALREALCRILAGREAAMDAALLAAYDAAEQEADPSGPGEGRHAALRAMRSVMFGAAAAALGIPSIAATAFEDAAAS